MQKIFSLEQLQSQCEVWQSHLRLSDWDIEVKLVDFIKVSDYATAYGDVDMAQKSAMIEILTEEGHRVNFTSEQDMLSSLVHELLHLHFIFTFNEEVSKHNQMSLAEYNSFEVGINLLAAALVSLYWEVRDKEDENSQLIADKMELESREAA